MHTSTILLGLENILLKVPRPTYRQSPIDIAGYIVSQINKDTDLVLLYKKVKYLIYNNPATFLNYHFNIVDFIELLFYWCYSNNKLNKMKEVLKLEKNIFFLKKVLNRLYPLKETFGKELINLIKERLKEIQKSIRNNVLLIGFYPTFIKKVGANKLSISKYMSLKELKEKLNDLRDKNFELVIGDNVRIRITTESIIEAMGNKLNKEEKYILDKVYFHFKLKKHGDGATLAFSGLEFCGYKSLDERFKERIMKGIDFESLNTTFKSKHISYVFSYVEICNEIEKFILT